MLCGSSIIVGLCYIGMLKDLEREREVCVHVFFLTFCEC